MAAILLVVGAAVGAVGAFLVVRQVRFLRRGIAVDGRIGRYTTVQTTDSEGKAASTTMVDISFTTVEGRKANHSQIVLTRRRKPGTVVTVVYDPDDLERVQVVGSFWQWGPSALVLGAALAIAGSGVVLLVV